MKKPPDNKIARGAKEVLFASKDSAKPAKFYMVSAPAHCSYETRLLKIADAAKKPHAHGQLAGFQHVGVDELVDDPGVGGLRRAAGALGGENQAFDDMDNIPITELR